MVRDSSPHFTNKFTANKKGKTDNSWNGAYGVTAAKVKNSSEKSNFLREWKNQSVTLACDTRIPSAEESHHLGDHAAPDAPILYEWEKHDPWYRMKTKHLLGFYNGSASKQLCFLPSVSRQTFHVAT
jgi:hypothetical protein